MRNEAVDRQTTVTEVSVNRKCCVEESSPKFVLRGFSEVRSRKQRPRYGKMAYLGVTPGFRRRHYACDGKGY